MATIQSYNTANPGNGSSVTVTKPTGLAVGDLMIAHYAYGDATDTMGTLSGWTHEVNNESAGGTSIKTGIQWKIADSGDVAASNFTFSLSGASNSPIVALIRIDGYVSTDLLNNAGELIGNSGSPSYNNTVTPISPSSLMLFFITAGNPGATPNISNYAMTTDNPTWSELYQVDVASSHCISLGYATRTATTATGNSSATITGSGSQDSYGAMVSIGNPTSVTTAIDAPGVLTLNGNEPDFILGNVFSIDAPGVLTLNGNETTIETGTTDVWTPETKPTDSIWTPTDK